MVRPSGEERSISFSSAVHPVRLQLIRRVDRASTGPTDVRHIVMYCAFSDISARIGLCAVSQDLSAIMVQLFMPKFYVVVMPICELISLPYESATGAVVL